MRTVRTSTPRTFTVDPGPGRVLDRLKASYGGNASRVVNALLREAGEARGWFDLLGLDPRNPPEATMRIEILSTGSGPLRTYHHNGETFAEAPSSGEYTIRLTNTTGKRIEAVLSVDGVDAICGKDASYEHGGWVLGPYQSIDVPGYFRDHAKAAAFTFSAAGAGTSYAEKTGRGRDNVGVIGVAVFHEKAVDWGRFVQLQGQNFHLDVSRTPVYGSNGTDWHGGVPVSHTVYPATMDSVEVQCSTALPTASVAPVPTKGITRGAKGRFAKPTTSAPSDVGTAYGREVEMKSVSVSFQRASVTPAEIVSVRYATREMLRSWGVPVDAPTRPNPFPASAGGVPAPAGWTPGG